MINYRENAYIPPPPPSFSEKLKGWCRDRVQAVLNWFRNLRKNLSFWWRFNQDSIKGFGAICVFLCFFLCCCYGIAAGDITVTAPSGDDHGFHHDHDRIGHAGHVGHIGHRIGRSRFSRSSRSRH